LDFYFGKFERRIEWSQVGTTKPSKGDVPKFFTLSVEVYSVFVKHLQDLFWVAVPRHRKCRHIRCLGLFEQALGHFGWTELGQVADQHEAVVALLKEFGEVEFSV